MTWLLNISVGALPDSKMVTPTKSDMSMSEVSCL